MNFKTVTLCALGTLLVSATADSQVTANLVAATGIPAGNVFAPHTPSGTIIIGNNLWVGDEAQDTMCRSIRPMPIPSTPAT